MGWDSKWETFDTPKSFGQVMKEFNEEAKTIIGVDKADGKDTTVVGITDGKNLNIIGESVDLVIPFNHGWTQKAITAIRVGDLAVYFGDDPDIGLVIHVPTLTRFDNAIPDGNWTQEQMINWCWKVQQSRYDLWEDFRKYTNSTYKTINSRSLELMREYCLSIKPDG